MLQARPHALGHALGPAVVAFAVGFSILAAPRLAQAATRQVGPGKTYAKPCAAIAAAAAGDIIEVDAAGSYDGDHCAWTTDNLTIRGVGGRAKIDAGKNAANVTGGKGIFVIGAPNATVENFELAGAVSADANGAGIRHEGTNLTVRNCFLHDNDDGILGSPAVDGVGEVLIESSELAANGAGDGLSHNMYLNHYAKLTLRYSYSHGAKVGHLVKTRARVNYIVANRLTDEAGATASYELNVPSAGTTFVIGNLIEQSAESQNPTVIDYASEPGTLNPDTHLFVVNNTLVNSRPAGGTFIADPTATPAVIINNIFVGPGTVTSQANAVQTTNFTGAVGDAKLVSAATYDYHLTAGSPCANAGTDPGMGGGQSLVPLAEYTHPRAGVVRTSVGTIDIGAYEFGNPGGLLDGGASSSSTSSTSSASSSSGGASGGGAAPPTNGDGSNAPATDSGGCGCRASGSGHGGWLLGLGLALGGLVLVRRPRNRCPRNR